MHKNYKNYIHKAKQQGNFARENFTYTKMKEKFSKILEENVTAVPKQVGLKLPKLKKIGGDNKPELPKLKLPKLKKIGEDNKPELPKLKLPKLKKVEI
jgi:hypothetical protein